MGHVAEAIQEIIKRDGSREKFDINRIINALRKAQAAVGMRDDETAKEVAENIVEELAERPDEVTVERVQDLVEKHLVQRNLAEVAKAYMLHRAMRADIRHTKRVLGVRDDLKLNVNAIKVLERRYLMKDENGRVVETPRGLMQRVAKGVAAADNLYGEDAPPTEGEFYSMLAELEFLPNSPTLMNAGTRLGQLAGCFVLPIRDSIVEIFDSLKTMAIVHQSGGGTGFSFSRIRPNGDIVRSTGGVASGPVSFMQIFDASTNVIKQGGRRRGANMAILRVDHPDILEFVMSKINGSRLRNFNISVAATDSFMKAIENDDTYDLINPRTGKSTAKLRARHVFELITMAAWRCGDPGMIFIDEINRQNPTPDIGTIESTNPCGEQPLLPYESCNLGSINLRKMVTNGSIDWDRLGATVDRAVHFLDNVIDVTRFPLNEIEQLTRANRKIGLGVMGFAEMLILLSIPYDSEEALQSAEEVMKFIQERSHQASQELARRRGSFTNFDQSTWRRRGFDAMRNATVTTIAPTGTISIIAGVSSGIEPLFALSYYRNIMDGSRLLEENDLFKRAVIEQKVYTREFSSEVAQRGSIAGMDGVPQDLQRRFVTAHDISPEWHVRMQAAFQKYTDNAVSKTVNLHADATQADVKDIYLLAYRLKCKGITIYRYGTVPGQVLELSGDKFVEAASEFTGECRECAT